MRALGKMILSVFKQDARKAAVKEVLSAFKDMGGSEEELAMERLKLEQDDGYLAGWQAAIRRTSKGRSFRS